MRRILRLLLLLIFSFNSKAYVFQKTIGGKNFHWNKSTPISIYVTGVNSSGINSTTILNHVQTSASQWNQQAGAQLNVLDVSDRARSGRNDFYFSNDTNYFAGSAVLAVTENIYREEDGQLLESDIIIKDSVLYTNNSLGDPFIGNIISHELGHFLGLDHSPLPFSTMFYKLTRGQHSLSEDDRFGKSALYNESGGARIHGRVAGSESKKSVFGANVQLISSNSGKVITSTLSDQNGYFSFENLNDEDVYYIFIAPLKMKETISPFYQTIKADFCTGFVGYKGAFFKSCDNSREGFPQGIKVNSATQEIDVGIVSIQCGLDVPTDYLQARSEQRAFELDNNSTKMGDSFSGYFLENEVENSVEDEIFIDLSDVNTTGKDLYLNLRVISQQFYSMFAYEMSVESPSTNYNYTYTIDSDTNPNLDMKGLIPLDRFNQANNIFTIKIRPLEFSDFRPGTGFSSDDMFFPDFLNYVDGRYFYQFIYFLSESDGVNYSPYGFYDYNAPRGNERCMEGVKTYSVKPAGAVTGVTGSSTSKRESDSQALACGSIDMNGGNAPPSGGGIFIVIAGMMLAISLRSASSRKQNF